MISDIILAAGRTQHVQVFGPDGRPVLGTKAIGLQRLSLDGDLVTGAELSFVHANPGKPESIVIVQKKQGLGVHVKIKGDEPDPIRVTLQKTGTVTGRLVDEDGIPRPNVPFSLMQDDDDAGTDSTLMELFNRRAQERTRRPVPGRGARRGRPLRVGRDQEERDELFLAVRRLPAQEPLDRQAR